MTNSRQSTMLCCLLLAFSVSVLTAQSTKKGAAVKPSNMWEVGLHGGYFFVSGDVSQKPGYAAGLSVRKATDYVFSLRADLVAGKAKGENPTSNVSRDFTTEWYSGTGYGVLSFNNFRFDKAVRKLNYYALIGAGADNFRTEFNNEEERKGIIERDWAPHVAGGAGIAYRLGKRVNIGLEHQAFVVFGRRADLVDGTENEDGIRTPFRDIVNYTSLKVNINIGDKNKNTEPLYWINPLDVVLNDMEDIKKKQQESLADSDNDGVIDAIDQEPTTPANVPVDTKGRTLDSDKDGIPDYKDKEPYYPPRAGERVNSEGVVVNPINPGGGGVTEERVKELIDEVLDDYNLSESKNSVAEWFLPMIHFGTDSHAIKYSDYGTLASIARMMKTNPQLRLVVTGYTDATAAESYNDYLSYQRAKSVIDHLVTNHGIGRGRLVLQWRGEMESLVPSNASYMNRRVEFRAAEASDVEMDPPASPGPNKKKSGY